ncbi:hypothetical protein EV694_1236 [Volucribacter psittacicida]|uniref:Uncharacterized protein n=1 Tax=Volucribacter psittacicida TaxID=203482 RepID=A0A4R1FYE8_9PAST|nr:hypothetical protein [Volucribacter psittacicida]TCJ98809.1 hypothetical protein EV694_1236 [Volucribacter psittacicida]
MKLQKGLIIFVDEYHQGICSTTEQDNVQAHRSLAVTFQRLRQQAQKSQPLSDQDNRAVERVNEVKQKLLSLALSDLPEVELSALEAVATILGSERPPCEKLLQLNSEIGRLCYKAYRKSSSIDNK